MRTSPEDYQPSRCAGLLPTEVAKLIEESRAPLLAALDKAESALIHCNQRYAVRGITKEALAAIRKVKGEK